MTGPYGVMYEFRSRQRRIHSPPGSPAPSHYHNNLLGVNSRNRTELLSGHSTLSLPNDNVHHRWQYNCLIISIVSYIGATRGLNVLHTRAINRNYRELLGFSRQVLNCGGRQEREEEARS